MVTDHIGLRGPRPLRVSIRPVGTPRSLPSVFMCRLLSYTFCVNILILKRYYKVFILFFQYYIFIIFFIKNNEIIKTNDLTRKSWRTGIKKEVREQTWNMRSRAPESSPNDLGQLQAGKTHRRDGLAVEDYDGAAQGHIFPWHHARWWFTRGGRAKLSLKTFTKTKSYCCGFHKRSPTAKERTQGNKLAKQKPPTAEAIKGSRTTPTWCYR